MRTLAVAFAAAMALVAGVALGTAVPARADIGNAGLTAAGFLALPPGAASPGMAGATLALGGDLAAANFNPASLGWMPGLQIALSHSELADGSRHEWAALGGKLGGPGTRWALSGLYVGQGPFEGRDALNQPTGSFTASSFAGGVSLAQPLARFATVGLGVKVVGEQLANVNATGVTFDGGILARAGFFGIGASARNVGGSLNYGGVGYKFPINYGAGVSFDHPCGLRLAVDANFPYDYYNDVRAGVEYRWRERFALRGGYRYELSADTATEPLTGATFGLGAGMRGVWLDYAWLPSTAGQSEQRLAIVLTPGKSGWGGGELGAKQPSAAPVATSPPSPR